MPPINPIKILGHLKFSAAQLKLPTKAGWKQPKGNPAAKQYATPKEVAMLGSPGGALKATDWIAISKLVPPFFYPQNPQKYHVKACDEVGKSFKEFHDKAIDAVKYAHQMWKLKAKFKDLKVMSVSAIGTPGCLDGPKLENDIKNAPSTASMQGNEKKYRDAVAKGVSECFKKWQDKVTVPGLPWYPAFAAFPLASATPLPNVPMPLIACPSAKMTEIVTPDPMKKAMIKALDKGLKKKDKDKQHEVLFESIATVLSLAFLMWLPQQQVMLVQGKGPVPSYAPPYVPVGPVVAGDNIASPGHCMA